MARRLDPLVPTALAVAVVALTAPAAWLTGSVEAGDPLDLAGGVRLFRGAGVFLASFLLLAARAPRPASGAPSGAGEAPVAAGAVALLCALALVLRLYGLNVGAWYDELWMQVEFLGRPPAELWSRYPTDNHHVFYTLNAWLATRAFGLEPWALRLPALVFGVASLVGFHLLARGRVPRAEALAGLALLATSLHHVDFSQNARGYTGLLCFTLFSAAGFLAALERGARRDWILAGVGLALATWVHLTGVYVALAQLAVYALCFVRQHELRADPARRWAPLLGLGLGGSLSLFLHAPLLPQMLAYYTGPGKADAAEAAWNHPFWALEAAAQTLGGGAVGWGVLLLGLAVGLVGWASLTRERAALGLLGAGIVAIAAGVLLAMGRNLWPRTFFFAAGFFVLAGVRGLRLATASFAGVLPGGRPPGRERLFTTAVLLAVLANGVASVLRAPLPRQDFVGAMEWLDANAEGRPVLAAGLAIAPYTRVYGASYRAVESAAELERAVEDAPLFLVFTLPEYIGSRHPDLWQALLAREADGRATEVARFPGRLGGGDLVVLSLTR